MGEDIEPVCCLSRGWGQNGGMFDISYYINKCMRCGSRPVVYWFLFLVFFFILLFGTVMMSEWSIVGI